MTKDQESAINILITRDDFGYNRLWEFCEYNEVPLKEAIRYVAEITAHKGCKGCRRVGPYMGNSDCLKCSRHYKDYYVSE